MIRLEVQTFSAEAHEVARIVYEEIDCDAVRARDGQTSTDVRERGEQRYAVHVTYGCAQTRVVVSAEDGRLGTAGGPRLECCQNGGGQAR